MKGIEDKYLGASQMISDKGQTVKNNYILKETVVIQSVLKYLFFRCRRPSS